MKSYHEEGGTYSERDTISRLESMVALRRAFEKNHRDVVAD